MAFTNALLAGIAARWDAAGIADWQPTGAYDTGATPIVIGGLPPAPDVAIALMAYAASDDASLSDSVVAVQVRIRGDANPSTCDDLADAVFDDLHGATAFDIGTVRVVEALRQSSAVLGRDESGRWDRSDNYYLTVWRPSAHRE